MNAPAKSTSTWRLVVAYHGGQFMGWQRQAGVRTVQAVLEDALGNLAGERVTVRAAGRTDAGVHARGQVVSSTFASRVPADKMVQAVGSQLPVDVSVVRAQVMPEGFDAKYHSVGKRYVYRIHQAVPWDPFDGPVRWHHRGRLDVEKMRAASSFFVGEQDFESFRSTHCDAAHARRFLWRSEVQQHGALIEYEVRGNAFCRHMVRCLAGTLVDVGRGRIPVDEVPRILVARDRRLAGVTAPAEGLTLEEVYYPDTLQDAGVPADARFPGFPVDDDHWPPRPYRAQAASDDEGAD